ncbi:hypothetical protein BS47DRAFT_1360923 [Hydnum rufescens UP504]|uniref:Uncharacterized protein n=1 Tax=Hydnum rufescens UP504 TaxID=1448309 RepID=A0A9P6DY12_9AGAM|nr:hypothetical protein BS47DRAFT_1360923 [Hydnum rufescens UP504]
MHIHDRAIEDISYLKDQLQSLVAWLKGEWRQLVLQLTDAKVQLPYIPLVQRMQIPHDGFLIKQIHPSFFSFNVNSKLGAKSCAPLGQKLDWPLHIWLAAAAGDHEDGGEIEGKVNQEEEEFQLLGGGGLEFEAENTEVDDFVVECLIDEGESVENEGQRIILGRV